MDKGMSEAGWRPSRGDLRGLGPAGRQLVTDIVGLWSLDIGEGQTLIEAAHAADELARLRAIDRATLNLRRADVVERQIRQWSRLYQTALRELRLSQQSRLSRGELLPAPSDEDRELERILAIRADGLTGG
jgi:hypothetical protein